MSVKKVQFDGNTLIDLTQDTVTASKLHSGYTAHDANGDIITGSYNPPSGSMNIANNGTYDVTDKAQVIVNVPVGSQNSKCFVVDLNSAPTTGAWYYFNNADQEIAFHINDPTFVAVIVNTTDSTTLTYRTIGGFAVNHKLNSYGSQNSYGAYARTSAQGATGFNGVSKSITDPTSGTSQMVVTSDGRLGIYCATNYAWTAGTYVAMCGW